MIYNRQTIVTNHQVDAGLVKDIVELLESMSLPKPSLVQGMLQFCDLSFIEQYLNVSRSCLKFVSVIDNKKI